MIVTSRLARLFHSAHTSPKLKNQSTSIELILRETSIFFTTTSNRQNGTSKHRRKEAKEEVVQGKGCALKFYHALEFSNGNWWKINIVKDKAQHAVILDKSTSDRLAKDVQSYRLVTVAVLVDRLKINGSLARRCLKELEEKGQIKIVVKHHAGDIYSMSFIFRYYPFPIQRKNTRVDSISSNGMTISG